MFCLARDFGGLGEEVGGWSPSWRSPLSGARILEAGSRVGLPACLSINRPFSLGSLRHWRSSKSRVR